jgi:2-C-methyl-D-erythritol 2,4-cyclodiphosphate synthase
MICTGIGYDVHRFAAERKLIIGGVEIPHDMGLDGHSDADVLCHAIADALLGAAGEPDIGHFFPPSDPAIKGISSLEILRQVAGILAHLGAVIHNVDSTLVAERPKMLPHVPAMKENIARALGISPRHVGVKATTNEKLGFAGREEGICAMAVACIDAPH